MPDPVSKRALPIGLTPRLLNRDQSAAYCGVIAETFEAHIRPYVRPLEIGTRRLWDIKALDRWLDQRSGLTQAVRSSEDWLREIGKEHDSKIKRRKEGKG